MPEGANAAEAKPFCRLYRYRARSQLGPLRITQHSPAAARARCGVRRKYRSSRQAAAAPARRETYSNNGRKERRNHRNLLQPASNSSSSSSKEQATREKKHQPPAPQQAQDPYGRIPRRRRPRAKARTRQGRSSGPAAAVRARFNVLGSFIKTCPLGPGPAEEPGQTRAETCSTRLARRAPARARAANKKRTSSSTVKRKEHQGSQKKKHGRKGARRRPLRKIV